MRHRSKRQGRLYAAIPNAAMRDCALSLEARGMLALLMTYADDWEFQADHLMEIAGVGRDKFRRIMSELRDAGYVVRVPRRNDDGHLAGSEWMIIDGPEDTPSSVYGDRSSLDDGERVRNTLDHRPPENPAVGKAHRPPENPTAGFSGPIRKTKDKNIYPPTPHGGGDGVLIDDRLKRDEGRAGDPTPATPAGGATAAAPDPRPETGHGGAPQGDFAAFWDAYPNRVERDAARKAWDRVLSRGEVTAEGLTAAATAYAGSREVARGFSKKPGNWLREGTFRDWLTKASAQSAPRPDDGAIAAMWVQPIRAGMGYVASAMPIAAARQLLAQGAVTEAELRACGVQL